MNWCTSHQSNSTQHIYLSTKSLTHNFRTIDMELWKFGCNKKVSTIKVGQQRSSPHFWHVRVYWNNILCAQLPKLNLHGQVGTHTHTWEHTKLPAQLPILNHIMLPVPPPHTHTPLEEVHSLVMSLYPQRTDGSGGRITRLLLYPP